MTESQAVTYAEFLLPPIMVSKLDVAHMVSEAERVDTDMTAAAVRAKTGSQPAAMPVLSEPFQEFLVLNKLSLVDSHQRADLIKQLRLLKDKVPIIHMTFAVPADLESLQQLAAWLRTSIHPQVVIAVGLQPALVAGVYLRTPNHVHDLSVRGMLEGRRDLLTKELETLSGRV